MPGIHSQHHSGHVHRWRRHRPWWGAYPGWNTSYDSGDFGDDQQDGDSDSQEVQTPTLCAEDRCTAGYISWVQQALNRLGARLKVTGLLDRDTINALARFKQQHGVSPSEYYASPVLEQALIRAGASQAPAARRLACGPTPLNQLLPVLAKYRGDFPAHYLLAWITVESGGRIGELTKLCERGYFQIHPEESQDLALDHDRLSTDPEYSVAGGIKLVRRYASGIDQLAQQYGLPRGGDLYWGLVKLRHWIPSAAAKLLARMHQDGAAITDWNSIRTYVAQKAPTGFGGFDVNAGIRSVDHFLAMAKRWQAALQRQSGAASAAGASH